MADLLSPTCSTFWEGGRPGFVFLAPEEHQGTTIYEQNAWLDEVVGSSDTDFVFTFGFLRQGLLRKPRLASNSRSFCLCLLECWDYRHALPCLAL
jgi:hypothetical protein